MLIDSLSEEDKAGLGVAFNEATLVGIEIDEESRTAALTLAVLALDKKGRSPKDPRLQIILYNVGRAAASLRLGSWDDESAPVVAFPPSELMERVLEMGGLPIYGWEFFDLHEREMEQWGDRTSFDVELSPDDGRTHSLTVFQEGNEQHLDVCIWFDGMLLRNAALQELALDQVIAAGQRWWDALDNDPSHGQAHGIFPLRGD